MTPESAALSAETQARNGQLFSIAVLFCYVAAPVIYVGVAQATLCSWLGASAAVASLPAALSALGGVAPLFASWLVPFSCESSTPAWCFGVIAAITFATGVVLVVPFSNDARLFVVIVASMLVGVLSVIGQVYLFQSLKRGTTESGRARTLKFTYTAGPIVAVAGSLAGQAALDSSWDVLATPANFALLYFIAAPCMLGAAVAARTMRLAPGENLPRTPLGEYLFRAASELVQSRALLLLCVAYAAWNVGTSAMPTLSLYSREAIGVAPESLAGYILALRFGCKSVANYFYGIITERFGARWTLFAIQATLLAAMAWAASVTGYAYLGAFALLGASELGGVYFPNQCLSLSSAERGARNLSVLMIAQSAGGVAAAFHGALADHCGFSASFLLAAGCALAATALIAQIPIHNEASTAKAA